MKKKDFIMGAIYYSLLVGGLVISIRASKNPEYVEYQKKIDYIDSVYDNKIDSIKKDYKLQIDSLVKDKLNQLEEISNE